MKLTLKLIKNNWQITLVLVLALVLRLVLIGDSFWLDEAAQALEIVRPTNQQLNLAKDFQPPLLHLILHFAHRLTGIKSEWFLRSIGALIPGLVTIWATYKIGEKIANKKAGLLAALLLASNSFHIFYSQELRPYSLPAMIGTLSWLTLLKLQATSSKSQTNLKSQILNITILFILSSLGLYSSYLYPFLILSQIAYVLLFKRRVVKAFFYSLFFSFLAFLPWLPMFLQQLKIGTAWQSQLPGWSTVVSITQFKSLPLVFGKFLYGVIDLEISATFFFSSFFIVFLLLTSSWQTLKQINKEKSLKIILIWLMIPLLSAWLVSFIIPVLRPKRVLYLLPAFYLFVSYLLYSPKKSLLVKLTLAILLTTNLLSTFSYYRNPNYQREDWRNLQSQIYNKFDTKDTLLIFSFDEVFAPWIWYEKNSKLIIQNQKFDTLVTGKLYINNINNLEKKLELIKNYKTILVFDYLRDLTDPDDRLLSSIRNKGFAEVGALDQENIGLVRIYLNLH
ncbi:MAG: glycosyltransferase family 39 protein [Patescibacteria group bacterium]